MNVCIVSIHIFTQLSVTYGDIINIILAIFSNVYIVFRFFEKKEENTSKLKFKK